LLITTVVAAGFVSWRGLWGEALAAAYGGGIALAAAWWFWRGLVRSANASSAGVRGTLYGGALQRFAFIATAFAAGIGWLALAPAPLLAAYGGCQLGYLRAATGDATK
jgi:hypothetical protein